MKTSTRRFMMIGAVLVLMVLAIVLATTLTGPKQVVYSGEGKAGSPTLETFVKQNKVETIYISGNYSAKIKLVGAKDYTHIVHIPSRVTLKEDLAKWQNGSNNIQVKYDEPTTAANAISIISPIILAIALIVGVIYIVVLNICLDIWIVRQITRMR